MYRASKRSRRRPIFNIVIFSESLALLELVSGFYKAQFKDIKLKNTNPSMFV